MAGASHARVAVQLMPRDTIEGVFSQALKEAKKNPKLRIDNVRRSRDLNTVVDHCKRRWEDVLSAVGPYRLMLYDKEGKEISDSAIKIDDLCIRSGTPSDGKLSLTYTVKMEPARMSVSMYTGRYGARMTALPHEALLELAVKACEQADGRLAADRLLAQHVPLVDWARDLVLLSNDLLPFLFASLNYRDCVAAEVCQVWRDVWAATNETRRGLRPGRPAPLGELVPDDAGEFATTELPNQRLLVCVDDLPASIVDTNLDTLFVFPENIRRIRRRICDEWIHHCSANGLGLYSALFTVRRFELNGYTEVARVSNDDLGITFGIHCPILAPGNRLFVHGHSAMETMNTSIGDVVVCIDALTLEKRFEFGHGR